MTSTAAEIEGEALAFAREWVVRANEGDFFGLGCAPLHPDAGRLLLRRLIKGAALGNPFMMADLVECAEGGWDDAGIALRELIAEFVNRNEPLPAVLAAYNIKLLDPRRAPRTPGRKHGAQHLQDIAVVTLVMELIEQFHLRPTRNQDGRKRRSSACSIASRALTEAGLHRGGEEAMHRIWKRYAPRVLPGSKTEILLLSQ
jgi:hypothetical protein